MYSEVIPLRKGVFMSKSQRHITNWAFKPSIITIKK